MNVKLPESVINGRFQYSDRPNVLPGKCAVCGSVERPVIDFGMQLDFYGAVLLCTTCILEAASLIAKVEGATPVVSPFVILPDSGTINEYVHNAVDSINRLNNVLDYFGFKSAGPQDAIPGESKDEGISSTAESKSDTTAPQDNYLPFDEGPTSVSTSGSDESSRFFDL